MRTAISELMIIVGIGCAAAWLFSAALGLALFSPAAAVIGCGLIIAGCVVEGAA